MGKMESGKYGEILDRIKGRRIVVVGDLILDKFIWGRVSRISPEAPVPVVEVEKETIRAGGAANVAVNISSLGGVPLVVGVTGDDEEGEKLCFVLNQHGLETGGIIADPERRTSVKQRIIAQHQQVCRTDREVRDSLGPVARRSLEKKAREAALTADGVILSDYAKGTFKDGLAASLIGFCRDHGRFVSVDPKNPDLSVYKGASLLTPNRSEAEQSSGLVLCSDDAVEQAGKKIMEQCSLENLLITRGEDGMTLFSSGGFHHLPTFSMEVFDVTGAGDTVIAMFTLAVGAGASQLDAAALSNHAASVAVSKLGTAAVTVKEILANIESRG
jgi:D-beta-D-heptose 7-phosphate kinase/D-beta-D-heptose 1-phosphate adenosyltransferase